MRIPELHLGPASERHDLFTASAEDLAKAFFERSPPFDLEEQGRICSWSVDELLAKRHTTVCVQQVGLRDGQVAVISEVLLNLITGGFVNRVAPPTT